MNVVGTSCTTVGRRATACLIDRNFPAGEKTNLLPRLPANRLVAFKESLIKAAVSDLRPPQSKAEGARLPVCLVTANRDASYPQSFRE